MLRVAHGMRFGLTAGVVLVLAAGAGALDAEQEQAAAAADTAIKSAEADITAAEGSAGTADNPAKGSRLKLTKMRLDSAKQRLAQAARVLAELPAEDAAVQPVRARHDAAAQRIAAVEAIIEPDAPAEAPKQDDGDGDAKPIEPTEGGGGAPPAPAAPRLDYKQEKTLKDARWYLRQTQGYNAKAQAVVAAMDAEEGPKPVHSQVQAALGVLKTSAEKHKLAVDYINALPGEHPAVAETAKQTDAAGDTLGALRSRLEAEDARLAKITGLENYPQYQADFDLMTELGRRYANFDAMTQQPDKLVYIIEEDGQVLKDVQRIARTYLPLVEQKTDAGLVMEKKLAWFVGNREAFVKRALELKASLPALFEADLARAMEIAREGVEQQRPLYFGEDSGIAQQMGFAERRLVLLEAFDKQAAEPYRKQLEEARAQVKQMAKTLEAQIIANNPVPPDRYRGDDRDKLVALAKQAWAKQQEDAQVLAVSIPSEAWKRETRWVWGTGEWYKVDKSKLRVQLLVAHDKELAVIRPINLVMDHLSSDTLSAWAMDSIDEELVPQRFVKRDKIK